MIDEHGFGLLYRRHSSSAVHYILNGPRKYLFFNLSFRIHYYATRTLRFEQKNSSYRKAKTNIDGLGGTKQKQTFDKTEYRKLHSDMQQLSLVKQCPSCHPAHPSWLLTIKVKLIYPPIHVSSHTSKGQLHFK